MRICILSRHFFPSIGGLERIAEILALQFSSSGHHIEVITDIPCGEGDEHFPFKVTRTNSYIKRWQSFRRAEVILFMNVSIVGLISAIFSGRPIVISHHSSSQTAKHERLQEHVKSYIRRLLTRTVANISCSEFVARQLPCGSTVIANAYDTTLFKSQQINTLRDRDFVYCGRLVSDKGVDVLIRAFAQVARKYSDCRLTVIGDGPERTTVLNLIEQLGLSGNVSMTGALTGHALVQEISRHNCMVIPSQWEEPFGIVALGGIACCDHVIAARRGGLPEAVGAYGGIVEPTEIALSVEMLNYMHHSRYRNSQSAADKIDKRNQHLSKFTPTKVAERYLEILSSTVRLF